MHRLRHPFVPLALAFVFLLLWGALSAHAAAHAVHHVHHQAQTHANPFCAWLCAAGQVLEASEERLDGPIGVRVSPDAWHPSAIDAVFFRAPLSRAPPSPILIP